MPVTKRVENVKRIVSNKFVQKESGKNQLVIPVAQEKKKKTLYFFLEYPRHPALRAFDRGIF